MGFAYAAGFGLLLSRSEKAPGWMLLALGVYAFQILVSTLWMRPFTYGPVEWVWRMLSYGKRLPLKRQ